MAKHKLPDRIREAIAVITGDLEATRDEAGGSDFTVHGMAESQSGVWLSVGGIFSLHVKRSDEGLIVDVYARGCEDDEPLGSTYAYDAEAVGEIEDRYCTCEKPDGENHLVACEAYAKVKNG